jgi:hypothetical protein
MNLLKPLGVAAGLLAAPAGAAQELDPEWPCVQRKVDHLSLAVMWPEPVPDEAADLPDELDGLAERMALRRIPVEEIAELVDQLAAENPEIGADTYGLLFADAFERIDRQRTRLVAGIARYSRGQTELAREIDDLRREFAEVEAEDEPDFDRLDLLEAEIDWRERVLEERNSSLTYVCESPVLLEKRAYEIAQILLRRLD